MSEATSIPALAEATANRLRLHQINLADVPTDERRRYLDEEVKKALGKIVPEQRKTFLEELESRFPTIMQGSDGASQPAPQAPISGDVDAIVDNFLTQIGALSDVEQRVAVERLKAAGLVSAAPSSDLPEALLKEIKTLLQLGPKDEVDSGRLLSVCRSLIELVVNLDEVAWQVWSQVSPQSPLHRDNKMVRSLGRACRANAPAAEVEQANKALTRDREKMRALSAGLNTALMQVGGPLFRAFFANISPRDIWERTSGADLPGVPRKSAAAWKAYEAAAKAMDEDAFQAALYREIARITLKVVPPELVSTTS